MKSAESTALYPILDYPDSLEAPGDLAPLEALDALFRNTVEQAPVGIAFASRDGAYRYCNRTFCAMLGFGPEELSGSSIASLTLSDDLEATTVGLERLWRGEIGHLDVEKRYVRKDGSALWIRVSTSLVRRQGEEAVCSVEFLRDISVRKEMAAALVQNQTLLATLIAELPLALLACDVTGRMTHYNRAAIELFGIPSGAAAGLARDPYPLTSDVFRADRTTPVAAEERPLARALRGDEVSDAEFVVVRPDGAARTALSSARRLVGPVGQALGAVAVIQDITERRQADEELEQVHKQLLVASRHAGMAEVATNVLHNVGNVLNSVNVSASLLAERIKTSKCARLGQIGALLKAHAADLAGFLAGPQGKHLPEYLQELAGDLAAERDSAIEELTALRGNVEHIKEIVAMQQSYARRGGLIETLDVRVLVEDSLQMNEGAFSRHGVTIIRDYRDVPPIEVDKHKVLQILVNVIRNAKYACHEGTGEKTVTVRIRASEGSVLVSVIDTGVGIARENLERIFSHGFTTRADGHGFGLHSSALAAKALGGTLQAESAGPGHGATFTLTLPLRSPESSDAG
ncbi:MAG: PAS domain S-box protein [Gammaproteobacteria bacterium]|nr:MAG: PAS domain S-box protein [Gammaproteobacteria bacterium]